MRRLAIFVFLAGLMLAAPPVAVCQGGPCGHFCAPNAGAACGDAVCGAPADPGLCGGCPAGEGCFFCCCGCPGGCGPGSCGNGLCDNGETCATCEADCGPCAFCGDGTCNNGETFGTCPADCVPPAPGVDPGQACLSGDSRTVTLGGVVGDGAQIQMQGGPTVGAISHSFTGLAHDVAYSFRGRQHGPAGWSAWSAWSGAVFQDTEPPTSSAILSGAELGPGCWVPPVAVSITATDSGCLASAQVFYDLDGAGFVPGDSPTVTGGGEHSLTFYAGDGHHDEAPQTIDFSIDTFAPTTSIELEGEQGLGGWWSSPVEVSLNATDAGCLGAADVYYQLDGGDFVSGSGLIVTEDGEHTISFYATDGHNQEIIRVSTLTIDSAPPDVDLVCDLVGWPPAIRLDLRGDDAVSGLAGWEANIWVAESNREYIFGGDFDQLPYTWPVAEFGLHRVTFAVRDRAGNLTTFRDTCSHDVRPPATQVPPTQTQLLPTETHVIPTTTATMSSSPTQTQTATPTQTFTLTPTPSPSTTPTPTPIPTASPAPRQAPPAPKPPDKLTPLVAPILSLLLLGAVLIYWWGDRKSTELEQTADAIRTLYERKKDEH